MSQKIGRPKSNNPLLIEVKARIDKKTNNKLNDYCVKHGVNRTYVLRKGIEKVLNEEKE